MPQSPIPAQAYGRDPSLNFKPIQCDADGNVIVSSDSPSQETQLANIEEAVVTGAAVISNGLVLFDITDGPIEIVELLSICQTPNDATASTLQYQSAGTLGNTTQTITGASASLANAAAGTSVISQNTALATAPLVSANGANIAAGPAKIIVPAGSLKAVVGVGSTTGTWKHYLRYRPLAPGAKAVAAF